MPRRHAPPLDRPRLVPHAGLPGIDQTSRFAYSMETVGQARDAFKLVPLLPSPLLSSAAGASPAPAAAGVGALRGGGGGGETPGAAPALASGVGAALGDTSGVQGMAKGWSPATGAYTAPATGPGAEDTQ